MFLACYLHAASSGQSTFILTRSAGSSIEAAIIDWLDWEVTSLLGSGGENNDERKGDE